MSDYESNLYRVDIYQISNPSSTPVPLSGAVKPNCTADPLCSNPVCNAALDPLTRAKGLVDAMTFDEKVQNTQNGSPGSARLGLPGYQWWSEALHGVASSPGVTFQTGNFSYATSFPQPILMSAAFDDALIQQVGTVVSIEGRAFSNYGNAGLDFWTPNINPFRDPRWGRGQETPGEDPFHIARYVYNLVDGLQNGIGPTNPRVVATCKHFAGYDIEDWEGNARYGFNAIISTQDLSEYYLPPFKSCARDAKVDAIMCSYNAVNGIPTCADSYLLDTILRDHWNWNQTGRWVTSDCDAIGNIFTDHHYTSTAAAAAADALNAGTNLDCGTTMSNNLAAASAQDLFQNATLDTALTYLYSSLVRLGWFDEETSPYRSLDWSDVGTPASQQLAIRAAVEGIVLLKNDQTKVLPLSSHRQTIALIGPYANATTQLQGNYAGVAEYIRTLVWGAEQAGYNVEYALGTDINSTDTSGFSAAVAAANASDIVIYAGGIDNSIEAEAMDRDTISWPGNQLQLVDELSQVGKPLIVLQFGGGQLDDSALLANDKVNAILWAGYPSQAGGQAVFDILTGKSSPAGRLPITQYPANYTNEIPMTDMALRPNGTNPGRTYRWYDDAVIPFGYGLHYTNFDVSWASKKLGPYNTASLGHVSKSQYPDTAAFDTFHIDVKNTGKVTSDYVALLFASTKNAGPAPYPIKTLVGYARAPSIKPGETRSVSLDVTLGAIARTAENGDLVLYPGTYTLEVDVGQHYPTAEFQVNGPDKVLDSFPQPPSS